MFGNLSYGYGNDGNRISAGGSFARVSLPAVLNSASYDANNRLTQWGSATLSYDANGNMTSDGTNTYTWDARSRLSSMTGVSFQYDPFGRRTSRTTGGTTTRFLHDGFNRVQELVGSTVTANLITGLGVDETFTRTDSAGTRSLLPDALGSTIALTDNLDTIQTQYTYEPFGKTTASGPANANPLQYTGRESEGNGLYYYRERYYNAALQSFISEDPLDFAGGDVDLYAYVSGDPIDFRDPYGLSRWSDNFFMGAFDGFTVGARRFLPHIPGDNTDECSLAYRLGEGVPLALGGARLAYAGLAKSLPLVYRPASEEMARAASGMRNTLKRIFRAGLFPNAGMPSYEELLASKGTNEAVIQAASRTNQTLNRLGGAFAGSAVINNLNNGGGCVCK
jgi:RHS repeat-associated protein